MTFVPDADLETAKQLAEKFAVGGVLVKSLGKDILASLKSGQLPQSTYERLARVCHNRNVDNKRNVMAARELSSVLYGCIIQPEK